jgi:hypothetical protein
VVSLGLTCPTATTSAARTESPRLFRLPTACVVHAAVSAHDAAEIFAFADLFRAAHALTAGESLLTLDRLAASLE